MSRMVAKRQSSGSAFAGKVITTIFALELILVVLGSDKPFSIALIDAIEKQRKKSNFFMVYFRFKNELCISVCNKSFSFNELYEVLVNIGLLAVF
jgi:hypothetical protein